MPLPAHQTVESWTLAIPRSWGVRDYLRQRIRYLTVFLALIILGAVTMLLSDPGQPPGSVALWAGYGMLFGGGTIVLLNIARAIRSARNNADLDTPVTLTLDDSGVHSASVYGTGFSSWEALRSPVASPTLQLIARFCNGGPLGEPLRATFAAALRARCGKPAGCGRVTPEEFPADMRPAAPMTPAQCKAAFERYGKKDDVIGGICLLAAYALAYHCATGQNPFMHSFGGLAPGYIMACGYYGWGRGLVDLAAKKSAGVCGLLDEPGTLHGFDDRRIVSRRATTVYAARMERWDSWYETDDLFVLRQGPYLSFFPKSPWNADECRRLRESLRARVGRRI